MTLTQQDFTKQEWKTITSVQTVPRKYTPLAQKYPTIEKLVKMRSGEVYTLTGSRLGVSWQYGKVTLQYKGAQVEVPTVKLQQALELCKSAPVSIGKLFLYVSKNEQTPHRNGKDTREEGILKVGIDGNTTYVVLDELQWFVRAA